MLDVWKCANRGDNLTIYSALTILHDITFESSWSVYQRNLLFYVSNPK